MVKLLIHNGGCTDSTLNNIKINALPLVNFIANPVLGCEPMTVNFSNNTAGAKSATWDFGDQSTSADVNPVHIYSKGFYSVKLSVANVNGCVDSLTIPDYIKVEVPPVADFTVTPGINTETELSDAIYQFANHSANSTFYHWYFGDANTSDETDPSYKYLALGQYTVTLISSNDAGCKDTFTLSPLVVIPDDNLFVPNAFSPNGDGINDQLFALGNGIVSFDFKIFSRWGELIFASNSFTKGWDGTFHGQPMNNAVFVYEAEAKTRLGKTIRQKGNITLLR